MTEKKAIKVYGYEKCSTCVKALKYLDGKKVNYEVLPIVDQPPTVRELKTMAGHLTEQGGSFKNLFNTSGVQYRELGVAKLLQDGMTEAEAFSLLSKNGKLVKRPFLLTAKSGTVGFKEEIWKKLLK
jgi:arsenate reductase